MMISLSDGCPIFAEHHRAHLQQLLYTVVKRWHVIVNPSPQRMRKLVDQVTWSTYGEMVGQMFKTATTSSQSWVGHADCDRCDPARVARFYSLPTVVVVENAHSDGEWLRAIAEQLRPRIARLFSGANAMVDIANAGGVGEVPKELRRRSVPYVDARPSAAVPLRVVALADSDARAPSKISMSAREVQDTARELGASSHVLRKRSIENYIPDESLLGYVQQRADRAAAVQLVLSLSATARDHFPFKHGLTQQELDHTHPQYPPTPHLGSVLATSCLTYWRTSGTP